MVSTAAFHARVRGLVPGLGGLKETKNVSSPSTCEVNIVGSLCDREVACSAADRQGSNFESCVWRTVSSQSSHHPQEVVLAQFSLYVHKGGLKPDSSHFFLLRCKSLKFLSQADMTWLFQNLPTAAILGNFKMVATAMHSHANFLLDHHRTTCNTSFPWYLRSGMTIMTSVSIKT